MDRWKTQMLNKCKKKNENKCWEVSKTGDRRSAMVSNQMQQTSSVPPVRSIHLITLYKHDDEPRVIHHKYTEIEIEYTEIPKQTKKIYPTRHLFIIAR